MTRTEFVKAVAASAGITIKDAGSILVDIDTVRNNELESGGSIILEGIGKLSIVDTKASSGSMNGKAWSKPAGKKIKLSLSKSGKELV